MVAISSSVLLPEINLCSMILISMPISFYLTVFVIYQNKSLLTLVFCRNLVFFFFFFLFFFFFFPFLNPSKFNNYLVTRYKIVHVTWLDFLLLTKYKIVHGAGLDFLVLTRYKIVDVASLDFLFLKWYKIH